MTQQIIDTGAQANDGTGEPLRDAFTAVNENFTEIYNAGPVGSNVVITGNTIGVNGINNNLVLKANGVGNIQANSSIVPSINSVYNLGSATLKFNTVNAGFFVGNGSQLTGVTAAAATSIANGTSNVSVASSSNVTINIQNTSNTVVFGRLNSTFSGNILPAANVTYNLGSATAAWKDAYFSNSTIYLNNAGISANATAFSFSTPSGGTTILQGNGVIAPYANSNVAAYLPTYSGNLVSLTGPVTTTGNITGAYIIGNGSQLTGLAATYGNSNVASYLNTYSGNLVSLT
jgi:hypothetical protein